MGDSFGKLCVNEVTLGRAAVLDHVTLPPVLLVPDHVETRHLDFQSLVGHHAPDIGRFAVGEPVDVASARTMIAGGGQLQGTGATLELDHVLDASLAPGPFSDDHGPFVVLQAGAEDFAGRSAEVVDQDGDGEPGVGARLGRVPDPFADVSALGADDSALFNEHVRDAGGLAEQPSGIEAEVNDQGLHALLFELNQGGREFVSSAAGEMSQSHVTDLLLVIEHELPLVVFAEGVTHHRRDLNDGPFDGDLDHVLDAGAADAERDRVTRLALHQRNGCFQLSVLGKCRGLLAVDFDDSVAGLDPRFVGGASGQRRGDDQVGANLDPDPSELLADALLEPGNLVGTDVVGVLVEFLEHSTDGSFDQSAAVDTLDVIPLDLLKGLGEHPHQKQDFLFTGLAGLFLPRIAVRGKNRRRGQQQKCQQHRHQPGDNVRTAWGHRGDSKQPAHADLRKEQVCTRQ